MRTHYYMDGAYPPPAPPPGRRGPGRGGVRAAVLFACCLALMAALALASRLLPDAGLEALPKPPGGVQVLPTSAPTQAPTTVERAPLGDGTTLSIEAPPGGEAKRLQEIYEENLPSIVSVRGTRSGGMSLGTGVVMARDGYIITNSHVIEGCSAVDVVLSDERTYKALLVGRDGETDLAVLKISCTGLTPAVFGDSALAEVGDAVVAIGNPLGEDLRGTMTDGIISAINRDVNVDGRIMTLIQTNAALNAGNSGGALINAYGQVVGITNLKMQSYYDTVEGLGFAIPTTTVKAIVDTLIAQGVVGGRPTIGITAHTLTPEMARARRCPVGVYLDGVEPKSDAYAKGLRPGDVIVAANGRGIADMDALQAVKAELGVGDTLLLRVWREERYLECSVALVEQYTLED